MAWAIFSDPQKSVRNKATSCISSADDPAYSGFNLPLEDENSDALPVTEECDFDTLTPSNETLLSLAKKNPPPREWFEREEGCPF